MPSGVHVDLRQKGDPSSRRDLPGLPYVWTDGALKSAEATRQVEGAVARHPGAEVSLLLLNAGVVLDAPWDVRPCAVRLALRHLASGV